MANPTRRDSRTAILAALAASTALLLGTGCSGQLDSTSGPSVLVAPPSPLGSASADTPGPLASLRGGEGRSRRAHQLYDPLIDEYAERYGVEFELVKAMIHAESSFDPHAVSRRGARGLMQLMPRTARSYGARDLHDPRENIRVGVVHLRSLLDRFASLPLAIAAYNAGASTVRRHRGVPPSRETRRYVERVLRLRATYREERVSARDGF